MLERVVAIAVAIVVVVVVVVVVAIVVVVVVVVAIVVVVVAIVVAIVVVVVVAIVLLLLLLLLLVATTTTTISRRSFGMPLERPSGPAKWVNLGRAPCGISGFRSSQECRRLCSEASGAIIHRGSGLSFHFPVFSKNPLNPLKFTGKSSKSTGKIH